MTQINAAKNIVRHKGSCESVICVNCPAYDSKTTDPDHHLALFNLPLDTEYNNEVYMKAKTEWFKNWLKENKK